MLALAASVLVLVASLWLYERRNLYDTDIGEQRFIKLADGSTIDLNSRSQVRVSFSPTERGVELLQGQALFSVTKDKSRPFVVHSGATRVRAIGTQFDMYRRAAGTVVTVVEGRVAVSNEAMPERVALHLSGRVMPSVIELSAGEQATVSATVVKRPAAVDVGAATAWTQKQVIFRDTPLTEVVEEFNRYNTRKMRIADRDIQLIRISGAFSSTDPASLLRALDTMGVFSIEENSEEVRISRK
jgi:transmembrane sensor